MRFRQKIALGHAYKILSITSLTTSKTKIDLYTHENHQLVAMLIKTGCNNIVLQLLFTFVNNIVKVDINQFFLFDKQEV